MTSAYIARRRLATMTGLQYDGKRDVYESAGYKRAPTFEDYLQRYLRQGMAYRIVSSAPSETWRLPPRVLDGRGEKEAVESEFAKAWDRLTSDLRLDAIEADDRSAFYHLMQIDTISGIGQYGVLFLGFADGVGDLTQPLAPGSASELAYMEAYDEGNAQITEWDDDAESPRFGMPVMYRLVTDRNRSVNVHWTRVLHVASDGRGRVHGVPRLQSVLNDLDDLLKITAGSGEAAWRLLVPSFFSVTRPEYELGDDEDLQDDIDTWLHGERRWLSLEGVDVTPFNGELANPSPAADLVIDMLSAATRIPKRILVGAEAGELASTQDETNWAKYIESRQESVAGPTILAPFIKRMIFAGVLPMPASGTVTFVWPELISGDESASAQNGKLFAEFANAVGVQIEDVRGIVTTFWPAIEPEMVSEELEELPDPLTMAGDPKEMPEEVKKDEGKGKGAKSEPYP